MGEFNPIQTPLAQKESKKIAQLGHFSQFSSGAGSTIIKQDRNGMFIGGTNYENAPWAVDYQGNQYIGAGGEITLDGPNKKIVVGASDEIVIDGVAKTITTDFIKDKTYGLNGVFCKTHTSTNTSGAYSWNTGIPENGGLLTATLNYIDGSGYYKWLPGYNSTTAKSYFYIKKEDGVYKFWYSATNIYGDVTYTALYFTVWFNSQEASGW